MTDYKIHHGVSLIPTADLQNDYRLPAEAPTTGYLSRLRAGSPSGKAQPVSTTRQFGLAPAPSTRTRTIARNRAGTSHPDPSTSAPPR